MQKKLRVLCLPGYQQSPEAFRKKTGALRSHVKKLVDFEWVAAPLKVPPYSRTTNPEGHDIDVIEKVSSWYDFNQFYAGKSSSYYGIDESLRYIDHLFATKGPFDGVLGFSQGAAMTVLLSAIQSQLSKSTYGGSQLPDESHRARTENHREEIDSNENLTPTTPSTISSHNYPHTRFRFACVFSGFAMRDPILNAAMTENTISIPSFHCFGLEDAIITPERSQNMAACFDSPVIVTHTKGHLVPSNSEVGKAFKSFIENCCK